MKTIYYSLTSINLNKKIRQISCKKIKQGIKGKKLV